jgi:subtilisin family serine protease
MNRRLGAVAIVLMALTALAGVLSYVFLSKKDPQISVAQKQAVEDPVSPSLSPSTSSASLAPASSGALRPDQPVEFKPTAFVRDPSWRLLDWSVKPFPGKPGIELRASSWAASGKHSFIRVEEQIRKDASGKIQVLHIKEMVGDQIIVKLPEGATQENAETMAAKIGARAGSRPFAPDTWLFNLDQNLEAVPEGMENLKSSGAVIDYTEPDLIVRPARLPNDPKVTDFTAWHLYNNIQLDKDIKAAKAWDRRTSAAHGTTNKVIVAVLDSGVRYSHQDLSTNMWRNPADPQNGLDDDGNGWVDDVHGIDAVGSENFADGNFNAIKDPDTQPGAGSNAESYTDSNLNGIWDTDADPMDTDGHGTHCAGIIGAVGNNGIGLAGVAWAGVEIMALRFIDGTGSLSDEVLCMDYARLRGAKVINGSFGQDGGQSQTEINAISRLNTSGVILVAAAGNGGIDNIGDNNNGSAPFYPASYTNSNIIAVGATDRNDNKTGFSNFGATAVDLFAPGDNMYSTRTGSDTSYGSGSGTSFAAPVVSGALALLIAEYPDDTVSQRVNRVVSTNAVDVIPALSGLCVTGGRLNLAKLLPAADVNTLSPALVWHRPDHLEGLIPSAMRTPSTITLSNDVTIYSGLRKFNNTNGVNTNGLVNQTGGWLFFRTSSAVAWTSNALAWHTNNGDYQFWKATIPAVPARTFQYYLQLDFDSGARTTYSYYTNNADGFTTTTNQATAQSSPYTFTVPKATATVTISSTNQTYNGSARPVSISTTPSGLSNSVTYNGNSSAPTNAGTYNVVATVTDSNYEGSATSTLTITKASATISLGNLIQTYDGTSRTVTATTSPTNLPVTITYNGASSAPTNAGTYAVVGTINDTNYSGSASGSLEISKATATVQISSLSQIYDGSSKPVTVTTTPSGLSVSVTYDGSATIPSALGTYAVSATVTDSNYQGSASGTLSITDPPTATFASTFGGATPTSDGDGDGVPALVEYALGGGTNGNDQSLLPVATLAGSTLSMSAVVRTNDTNLLIYPEATLDLGSSTNWTSSGFTTNTSNQTNVPIGFQRREYQFNASTNPRAFLKLTIEQK